MSRVKRFTHSLFSGYVLLGASIVYGLVSVPLALHYLSAEKFGLWTLVMQLASFTMVLIDLGMSSSLARILIDYKDDKQSSSYGSVIQTGVLVLTVQALLMAGVGSAVSFWLPELMKVPPKFWSIFRQLMIWQCLVVAVAFVGKIFAFILSAHQRYDVSNYVALGGFLVNLTVLWVSFHFQLGLYSMITGHMASVIFTVIGMGWAVRRLQFLPARHCWGKPSRKAFRELFAFGTDVFLIGVGQQLVAASQVMVVTRTMGLEAAAVWSVAVKVFVLAQQVVYRVFDFSCGALAEMLVREERERLKARFGDIMILTGSLAAVGGLALALCNPALVDLLTHGSISWAPVNDWLMATSLFVYSLTRLPFGFAGVTKQIGAMKYVYFIEGTVFLGMALWLAPRLGFPGIIGSGIFTNLLFSGIYGTRRTVNFFNIRYSELMRNWLNRPLLLFAVTAICTIPFWLAAGGLNPVLELSIKAGLFGVIALCLLWRIGVPEHLRKEAIERLKRNPRLRLLVQRQWGMRPRV